MEMTNNFYNFDVENQFDLLLEVLTPTQEEGPLDLSIKREESFSSAPAPVSSFSSFYSAVSSPVSVCSSNSNDSVLDFDESFLPSPVSSLSEVKVEPQFNLLAGSVWPQQTPVQLQLSVEAVKVGRKGVCTNCGTGSTSTWRKDGEGRPLCNACGLYWRIHKVARPAEWARTGAIMRRQRKPKAQHRR